jgi:hypothetical protein
MKIFYKGDAFIDFEDNKKERQDNGSKRIIS